MTRERHSPLTADTAVVREEARMGRVVVAGTVVRRLEGRTDLLQVGLGTLLVLDMGGVVTVAEGTRRVTVGVEGMEAGTEDFLSP